MKIPLQSRKRGSINERFHLLSIGSCSDKTEKSTPFLSILLSLKTIGKGVKFQDITTTAAKKCSLLLSNEQKHLRDVNPNM